MSPSDLNPWLTIWFKPRKTIQWIIDHDPHYGFYTLIFLLGIYSGLGTAEDDRLGDKYIDLFGLVGIAILGGVAEILVKIYATGYVIFKAGQRLGGNASYAEIRAAVLWAYIPFVIVGLFYILRIVFIGHDIFTSSYSEIDLYDLPSDIFPLEVTYLCVFLVTAIWVLILLPSTVAQTQGFSILRAVASIALGIACFLAVIFVIACALFLIAWLIGYVARSM